METQEKVHFRMSSVDPSYEAYMKSFPLLSREQERVLFTEYKNGSERAKDKFYKSNLRLVTWQASKFKDYLKGQDVIEFMDLVQAGNMGLMTAIEKFELERETKFSTIATPWIFSAIQRFLADNGKTVRQPSHIQEAISAYNKELKEFAGKGINNPTVEDMSKALGRPVENVVAIEAAIYQRITSIDEPINEDGDTLESFVKDDAVSLDESVDWKMIVASMLENISKILSPREFEIVRLRFGLGNGKNYTLQEIGDIYGITRERVRQIEEIAFARLKGSGFMRRTIYENFGTKVPSGGFDSLPIPFITRDKVVEISSIEDFLFFTQKNLANHVPRSNFRTGQKPIYKAIMAAIQEGHTSMYIEGPTGIGKTFLEAIIADALLGNSQDKVLILTSKKDLLHQISDEISRFVPHRTNSIYGDGVKNLSGQIVIMTYDAYRTIDPEIVFAFRYVELDEAHKGIGEKTFKRLAIQKKVSILIGFTATATYSENRNLEKFLGLEVYKISIREAIKMGLLCAVQMIMASVEIEIEDRGRRETFSDYKGRLSSSIIQQGGNIAAARLYRDLFKPRNLRGIMFALDIKQGRNLVSVLEQEGVRARIITGKTRNRKSLLDDFKNHEFDVLVGIDVPKEGFNDIGVAVCIFTYPAQSIVDVIQGNGRVLRINEDNPDKLAYIVMLNFKGRDKQIFYNKFVDGVVFVEPEDDDFLERIEEGLFAYDTILGVDFSKIENLTDTRHRDVKRQQVHTGKYNRALKPVGRYDLITDDEVNMLEIPVISKISVTHEDVEKITRQNDPKTYAKDFARERLLEFGIHDYWTLLDCGPAKFVKLRFGNLGTARDLVTLLNGQAGRRGGYITIEELVDISEKLGWKPTEDEVKKLYINALGNNGITDYYSLIQKGSDAFLHTDFGRLGKGIAIANMILGNRILGVKNGGRGYKKGATINHDTLKKIAEKLGMKQDHEYEQKMFREALAENNIVTFEDLSEFDPTKFALIDFSKLGDNMKGIGFASTVLGLIGANRNKKRWTKSDFEAMAKKLKLPKEKKC